MAKTAPIVRKLSVKSIIGRKPKAPDDDNVKMLVRFYGVATGTKTGESNFGPWCALIGSFKAINLETGEEKRAGTCFLPDVALDMILPQLAPAKVNAVEFGFDIGVKKDDDSATGYIYVAEPCLQVSENDPLELITKKIDAPALPAPDKKESKKEKAAA